MLYHLSKTCLHKFVAVKKGLHVCQVMTEVQAAAMWNKSNVSLTQARMIICHLFHNFKTRVQVPLTHLSTLSYITTDVMATFQNFIV